MPDHQFMDARQQRIYNALSERRTDLASMYRTALRLLSEPSVEGEERTRISYICHSMREVMNRVLGAMGTSAGRRIKPSSSDQVQELPALLAKHPDLVLDAEGDLIAVPRGAARAFDKLIKTAVQEKRRSREDVASLLTDDGNSEQLVVKRWNETQRFFVKWAHLHDKQRGAADLPSDGQLISHIEVFNELFDAVITAFFARRRSIEELLAEINRQEEVDG